MGNGYTGPHYVETWQRYEALADGWPVYCTKDQKAWFMESIADLLKKHPDGLTMSNIYNQIDRNSVYAKDARRPDWALYDAWYACIHRTLIALNTKNIWRARKEGEIF